MQVRKESILAIRALRNRIFSARSVPLSAKEKLWGKCGKIEDVIGDGGQLWDSDDLADPLHTHRYGHCLGIRPMEPERGLVISLTGIKKIIGEIIHLNDVNAVAEQLQTLTGASQWRHIPREKRR